VSCQVYESHPLPKITRLLIYITQRVVQYVKILLDTIFTVELGTIFLYLSFPTQQMLNEMGFKEH